MHLDLRHLGAKVINAKLPFVRELCLKYQNIDPVTELIPVRPVVHYMMGGVHTDINGATPLPGLYAAGEVACVSINGANRLGSNSLPELLVFGARAGRAAAEYASRRLRRSAARPRRRRRTSSAGWSRRCCDKTGGRERIARSSRRDAEDDGGRAPASTAPGDSLARAVGQAARAAGPRRPICRIEDHSRTFNTERVAALELVVHARRRRGDRRTRRSGAKESRGAHQRTDFPARDDQRFLAHSLVYRNAATARAGSSTCR